MSREKEIYKVTLVGSAGNIALLTFKFIAGVLGNSAAMLADAVHSLSDFITDLMVIVFVNISSKPQDKSHDYGHGKFETLATFFVGLALVAAATGIIVSGAVKLADWLKGAQLEAPGKLALWAALISILVKEGLYQYTIHKGKSLDSQAVIANAWGRPDTTSSSAISDASTRISMELCFFMFSPPLVNIRVWITRGCQTNIIDQSFIIKPTGSF